MKCPVCPATDLLMTSRESIETDYCPSCRGVWLDRGELDRLIQRDEQVSPQQTAGREAWRDKDDDRDHRVRPRYDDHRYGDSHSNYGHSRKKKSFLGDLFDFG
ncbi:zf-TFIIB domain-containing protein [Caballeronia sp. GAWG2-1]|uniref:TFIIB-type zinc ribbon-containing protein n=1 Tax=Caballeronia sp. GAWG2-1 TaxID=2921744 RepID=UPI002027F2B3|nr:zf-TFIIB domain-containing protein [Caballeronia sp. GAWG2-1]